MCSMACESGGIIKLVNVIQPEGVVLLNLKL